MRGALSRVIAIRTAYPYLEAVPNHLKVVHLARNLDVGFAERRESAVNSRLELVKRMQERLADPESEARAAEHRKVVEARNKRLAEKEEIRRQEAARLAAICAAEEAKLAEERRQRDEEERLRLEAEQEAERVRLEAEKARLAASSSARAARALAEVMTMRPKRGGDSVRRQA